MDQKELENLLDGLIGAVEKALKQGDTEAVEIAKARVVLEIMGDDYDDYDDGLCDICGTSDC